MGFSLPEPDCCALFGNPVTAMKEVGKQYRSEVHSPREHPHDIVVDLLVEQISSVVFKSIFDGDDSENHQQRNHGDFLLKGLNDWHPVEQRQEQEVEVGSPVELLEKVHGDERQKSVLGSADGVALVAF